MAGSKGDFESSSDRPLKPGQESPAGRRVTVVLLAAVALSFAAASFAALCFGALSFGALELSAGEKDGIRYGMGVIVSVPFPESEVSQVLQDVVQNGIIRGTKEYNKDEYISGAMPAGSTKVF